jgi:putative colanic acid biosynthesis UDP-glucose lipid carrier transferase
MRSTASLMRFFVHLLDWCGFVGAGLIAFVWRFGEWPKPFPQVYALLILQAATMMLVVSSAIYRTWRGGNLWAMMGRIGFGWLATWGLIMTWLVLTQSAQEFSRAWLISWATLSLFLVWLSRAVMYVFMNWMRGRGVYQMRVLLVGNGGSAAAIQRRVKGATWTGYELLGAVSAHDSLALQEALLRLEPDEIWICPTVNDMRAIYPLLSTLRQSTANIRLVPDMGLFNLMNNGLTLVLGMPMLDVSSTPMSGFNVLLKWVEDKLLSVIILCLISPLLLVIALAVKVSSKGPVLFKQKRHGWNGETIEVYKFRSMHLHNENDGAITQAKKRDPRVTRVGRFIRSTSLDELPQFINVLQGQMSIVGPRPHAVAHNLYYRDLIPQYALRHKVKPGITG